MFKKLFSKGKAETPKCVLKAPMNGTIVPLEAVEDEVFSKKAMGDGVAIMPKEGALYAPADGVVMMVFQPSKHAVAIQTKDGMEVLIHVGMDTVKLDGSDFEVFVQDGDSVQAGDKLMAFDVAALAGKVPSIVTPIVITNTGEFADMKVVASGEVSVGDDMITF